MENDPIFCLQHCENDVNILAVALPNTCPICSQDVFTTPMKVPPFRLPSPFCDSTDIPYSIVIKPTHGEFLGDYVNGADLHIGITDSRGGVFGYDKRGVHYDESGWHQCLSVAITTKSEYHVSLLWDTKLQEFSSYDKWGSQLYTEDAHNCYSFALDFLKLMERETTLTLKCTHSKAEFSQEMVLPVTSKAAKYISLYRQICQEGIVVQYETSL